MVNQIIRLVKTYPVTVWATTGVAFYFWRASLVATVYKKDYAKWDQERREELQRV